MNVNVIRLSSRIKDDTYFNNLNDKLAEFGVVLKENVVNSPCTFVLIESGGTESTFKNKILNTLVEPVYIVSSNQANSLAASLEITTFLQQHRVKHRLFVNEDVADLAENMAKTILIKSSVDSVNGSRLGVIGKPSDWLIASDVSYQKVRNKFGIDLVDIPLHELVSLYENPELPIVMPKNIKELKAKAIGKEKLLYDALRIYSALKVLIKYYKLDGLTIRCFDVVNIKKVTACLALSLLNDEGYPSGCEGDIPALLTMFLVKKLINQEAFMVNPSMINSAHKTIMFAHCTIPLNMCQKYTFDSHYETDSSIGIKGELKTTIINLVKLSPDLENFNVTVGRINRNLNLTNACRTQIEVSLYDKSIDEFLNMNQANHVIVTYDNHKQLFEEFFKEF